jgi:hypothetical protein
MACLPTGKIALSFQRVPEISFPGNASEEFSPDLPSLFGQGIRAFVTESPTAINTFGERLVR